MSGPVSGIYDKEIFKKEEKKGQSQAVPDLMGVTDWSSSNYSMMKAQGL